MAKVNEHGLNMGGSLHSFTSETISPQVRAQVRETGKPVSQSHVKETGGPAWAPGHHNVDADKNKNKNKNKNQNLRKQLRKDNKEIEHLKKSKHDKNNQGILSALLGDLAGNGAIGYPGDSLTGAAGEPVVVPASPGDGGGGGGPNILVIVLLAGAAAVGYFLYERNKHKAAGKPQSEDKAA